MFRLQTNFSQNSKMVVFFLSESRQDLLSVHKMYFIAGKFIFIFLSHNLWLHTTSFLQNKFRQTFALKGDIKIILFFEKKKLKFKNEVFIFLLHFSTYNIKKLLLQIKFYPRYKNFEYSILS